MKIIKNQNISAESLRGICIREDLFTRGDNLQYEKLFDMVRNANKLAKGHGFSAESLYEIAAYIAEHSDSEKWTRMTGMEYVNFVENIMFCLYQKIGTDFEIIEG